MRRTVTCPARCRDHSGGGSRLTVPDVAFHAVHRVRSEKHREMLNLLRLAGAWHCDLRKLTTGMINRSGPIWRGELRLHKTNPCDQTRVLFFEEDVAGSGFNEGGEPVPESQTH